jgi:hypothetical protein
METERHFLPESTLEEFAEKYNLTMEIHERENPRNGIEPFYAHFKRCDVSDGALLRGTYGNGNTPDEAVRNYIPEISAIAINGNTDNCVYIKVPKLIS